MKTTNILYPAKKRRFGSETNAYFFPKPEFATNTWKYEKEFDRLNGLINVRRHHAN